MNEDGTMDHQNDTAETAAGPLTLPPTLRALLQRDLGPVEKMFHRHTVQDIDRFCFMTKLALEKPVTLDQLRKALHSLLQRHPLLRMTIRKSSSVRAGKSNFKFIEMEKQRIELTMTSNADWDRIAQEEMNISVEHTEGPLWRCRVFGVDEAVLVRPRGKCPIENETMPATFPENPVLSRPFLVRGTDKHKLSLMFSWHHAIIDAVYVCWIVRDFIVFLDASVNDQMLLPSLTVSLPLSPSIEHFLAKPGNPVGANVTRHRPSVSTEFPITRLKSKTPSKQLLNAYNNKFADEIRFLTKTPPKSAQIPFEYSKKQTHDILLRCKHHGVPINGIIWAASIAALLDMLYTDEETPSILSIPFDFIVDLRRMCPLGSSVDSLFAGAASTNITMAAELGISQVPLGTLDFWKIAKSFASGIANVVKTLDVFELIEAVRKDNDTGIGVPLQKGKSPLVLCVSNIGVLDVLVPNSVSERLKIVDLKGNSSILVDTMPIFFVVTCTVHGKLCSNISYCSSYTSPETATEFNKRFHLRLAGGFKL